MARRASKRRDIDRKCMPFYRVRPPSSARILPSLVSLGRGAFEIAHCRREFDHNVLGDRHPIFVAIGNSVTTRPERARIAFDAVLHSRGQCSFQSFDHAIIRSPLFVDDKGRLEPKASGHLRIALAPTVTSLVNSLDCFASIVHRSLKLAALQDKRTRRFVQRGMAGTLCYCAPRGLALRINGNLETHTTFFSCDPRSRWIVGLLRLRFEPIRHPRAIAIGVVRVGKLLNQFGYRFDLFGSALNLALRLGRRERRR